LFAQATTRMRRGLLVIALFDFVFDRSSWHDAFPPGMRNDENAC
jgi:hypothetical protein